MNKEIKGYYYFTYSREIDVLELLIKDSFFINNRKYFSRLFHCFGDPGTSIDLSTILGLLKNSCTQFLTVNTHNTKNVVIGYTNISLDDISKIIDIHQYTILNNTNLSRSWKEAVNRAIIGLSHSGSNIIKLEVLNKEYTLPINEEVIKAARILIAKGFEVWPLINANLHDAKELEYIGCSLVRVVGSPIGSLKGIENSLEIRRICQQLTIPVIVDGGIGHQSDVIKVMKLGATGVLVNKAIFSSENSVVTMCTLKYATIMGRILYLKENLHD